MNVILSLILFILGTAAVLVVMALVAWVTSLLEEVVEPPSAPAMAPTPASAATPPIAAAPSIPTQAVTAPPITNGIEPNMVAVITAAVTAALSGRAFRIQRIQLAGAAPVAASSSWAQVGRQSIHASHAIERKFR